MTKFRWIICEQSSRWAAALRTALEHQPGRPTRSMVLDEVRSLTELTDLVCEHPHSLVLLEVTPKDLEAELAWLTESSSRQPHFAAVALLDDRTAATAAVREAGASDVIHSPRQMTTILALGKRHALQLTHVAAVSTKLPIASFGETRLHKCQHELSTSHRPQAAQSFENWAWSLLPWQDARRPLG